MQVWGTTQALPQAPQLALSDASVTSQPLAVAPSQFARPAPHAVTPHASFVQVAAEAVLGTGHAMHAAPQVAGSVFGTHAPPHRWWVAGHVVPQMLAIHVAVPPPAGTGHTVHAAPQAVGSVFVTHLLPQTREVAGHVTPQTSLTQVAVPPPPGAGQGVQVGPHVAGSVTAGHLPAHAWNCGLHVNAQTPVLHSGMPFSTAGHFTLQPPQWLGLMFGLTHSAPHRSGSAAVQPVVHWNDAPAGAQFGAAA